MSAVIVIAPVHAPLALAHPRQWCTCASAICALSPIGREPSSMHALLNPSPEALSLLHHRATTPRDRSGLLHAPRAPPMPSADLGGAIREDASVSVLCQAPCSHGRLTSPVQRHAVKRVRSSKVLDGLLDCQPDFLAKRHLKSMVIGVADEGPIPDGRTSVHRSLD
jgi:hypothetical protein